MSITRMCDAVLDGTLVALASWTVTYHLSLVLGLPVVPALVATVVPLVGAALVWGRPRRAPARPVGGTGERLRAGPRRQVAVLVPAALAAAGMALALGWVLVWIPFLLAALSAVVVVVRDHAAREPVDRSRAAAPPRAPTAAPRPGPAPEAGRGVDPPTAREAGGRVTAAIVLAWVVGLAALSTVVLRPNPDDLYYLNLSEWIAANGAFPLRDTLFSELVFPMANWPPTASYDPLVGAIAHVLGARAATIAYVVVPPLATALAVLALWRLLRAWGVRHVAIALSAALIFLLFDGTTTYASPGNLFVTRLWQGKVILLCVVVPLLLVHALAYVEHPSRRGAARLFLGGAAAVALSTTALFLTPVLALAGAAPLLVRRRWRAGLVGAGAMAAYPLAGAVVTVALGGRSADDFGSRRLYRFDPSWFGPEIFLTGVMALIGVLAVLVGPLLLPRSPARITSALLVLATAITLVPGVTELGYLTVGLGPTLWRISWGCSVAALVGVLVVEVGARLRRTPLRLAAAGVVLALVVAFGHPIWAENTSTTFVPALSWKRGDGTRSPVDWLVRSTPPGSVVLAPDALGITLAVTTTELKTVSPRDYYMDYLREDPEFQWAERSSLLEFANSRQQTNIYDLRSGLAALDVAVACLYINDEYGAEDLRDLGWTTRYSSASYRCLRPPERP